MEWDQNQQKECPGCGKHTAQTNMVCEECQQKMMEEAETQKRLLRIDGTEEPA